MCQDLYYCFLIIYQQIKKIQFRHFQSFLTPLYCFKFVIFGMFDKMTSLWGHSCKWRHCDVMWHDTCLQIMPKVWKFFGQSFIDAALGVPEILREAQSDSPPPMDTPAKNAHGLK